MTTPTTTATEAPVLITSFGYGHSEAPEADLTIDARRRFRNPHADPGMRYLTGLDAPVRAHVLDTPGIRLTVAAAVQWCADLFTDTACPVTLAVGCVGGRHRSVALAEEIAAGLRADGIAARVEHRDVHRPVIQK